MKLAPPGKGRITRACWGPLNHTIISCGEDGNLYKWDTETGKVLDTVEAHEKMVQVGAEDGSGSSLHPRRSSPHLA
jgi:WD40 repeat protein